MKDISLRYSESFLVIKVVICGKAFLAIHVSGAQGSCAIRSTAAELSGNASLANLSTSSVPSLPATDITCLKEQFTGFRTLSQEQVRMLISRAAGKSCQLDPVPTPIVLKLLDVLLPVIT